MKDLIVVSDHFKKVMEEVDKAMTNEYIKILVSNGNSPESLDRMRIIANIFIDLDSIAKLTETQMNHLEAIQTSLDELKKR